MVTILMISANLATPGLLKIKIFRNKGYDVIIPDYDITNRILSRDSNFIVDVVMTLSKRPLYKDLTRKTTFFEGWSWFKFNNLGMALAMTLKFYTNVAKGLKLKVRKFWELRPAFVEVAG